MNEITLEQILESSTLVPNDTDADYGGLFNQILDTDTCIASENRTHYIICNNGVISIREKNIKNKR
mgnify:CR=1 FL=1